MRTALTLLVDLIDGPEIVEILQEDSVLHHFVHSRISCLEDSLEIFQGLFRLLRGPPGTNCMVSLSRPRHPDT